MDLFCFQSQWRQRETNSCFINNYNPALSKVCQTNIDLRSVYNYYKAVSYTTVYFSNSENFAWERTKQGVQEMKHRNPSVREAMKKLTYSFICSRQMSVKEAVYLCSPNYGSESVSQMFCTWTVICQLNEKGYSNQRRNC